MHKTAYENCEKFYYKYCTNVTTETLVLDFGSCDINGTLKPIFSKCNYTGLDISQGSNVDIVCSGNDVPLKSNTIDIIVSSSCFEHDECFWETFLEMCRLLKTHGYIYINAPSAAPYHAFPKDCWRFYFDSWLALEKYAQRKNYNLVLLERYIDESYIDKDSVGIFQKLD
jgi:SAM-dependent methyltransferase